MRLSIKLIFLLVTLFAFLELSNAVPKGRGDGGGRGGNFKSTTKSLYSPKNSFGLFADFSTEMALGERGGRP